MRGILLRIGIATSFIVGGIISADKFDVAHIVTSFLLYLLGYYLMDKYKEYDEN